MNENTIACARKAAGPHPVVETWVAYHAGELPQDEEGHLRGHLAQCPDCVALVLDLDAFAEPGGAEVSEFELAAAWRSMRTALEGEGLVRPAAGPARRPAAAGWRRFAGRQVSASLALAASLTVAVVGFGFWMDEHQARLDAEGAPTARTEPEINLAVVDLFPDTTVRSGTSAEPETISSDKPATLFLTPGDEPDLADYKVTLRDAGGRELWSGQGFEMDELGSFSLALPSGFLPPGSYELSLWGLDGETWTRLEDYPLNVR